jgi:hypothetical protein
MKILAIDPGNIDSAYVLWDGETILQFGKVKNEALLDLIKSPIWWYDEIAIEMIESYGMPVGKEVFDTCVWIGRYLQEGKNDNKWVSQIYRKDIKVHLCHSTKAKDSNVIQSLVDRFADTNEHGKYGKGTIKNKGFFFGFGADVWQAFAVAVYYHDSLSK